MTVLSRDGHDISGTTANRPTNVEPGMTYFDTDTNQMLVYNGTAWEDAGGSVQASFVYGEATPIDAPFFVAGRAYKVAGIIVRPLVAATDVGAVTAQIRKAPSGTAIASGTALHASTADLKGTINTNQSLTLSATAADLAIAAGDAIGIDVTGTTLNARGVVSVLLNPA